MHFWTKWSLARVLANSRKSISPGPTGLILWWLLKDEDLKFPLGGNRFILWDWEVQVSRLHPLQRRAAVPQAQKAPDNRQMMRIEHTHRPEGPGQEEPFTERAAEGRNRSFRHISGGCGRTNEHLLWQDSIQGTGNRTVDKTDKMETSVQERGRPSSCCHQI